jgi:hypothetical protein
MRWTRQRRRAVWRGRTALLRTAKSCGSDAPMLASSSQGASFLRATVANKPVAGESTKETVKTIAQGRPGVPVNLWSTTVCFLPFAHGAMGAAGTRFSLRPLFYSRANVCKVRAHGAARSRICVHISSRTISRSTIRFCPGENRFPSRIQRGAGFSDSCSGPSAPSRKCYGWYDPITTAKPVLTGLTAGARRPPEASGEVPVQVVGRISRGPTRDAGSLTECPHR